MTDPQPPALPPTTPGAQHPNTAPQSLPAAPPYPADPQHPSASYPGAAPYAVSQPSYGAAPATTRPPGARNPLARVALFIALIGIGINYIQTLTSPFFLAAGYAVFASFTPISGAITMVIFAVALAAVIIGVLAARRPGQHLIAGIAIGAAGSQALGIVVVWITNLSYFSF